MSTIHPGLETAIAGSDPEHGRDRAEFLAALDERPFQDKFVKQLPHGLRSIELITEGMNCTSCVRKLEGLNARVTGLVELRANLGRSLIRITWDPQQTQLSSVVRDVESLGYVTHPHRVEKGENVRRQEERKRWIRIAIAGAIAGNTMLISIALYAGQLQGIAAGHEQLFRWVSMILGLISLGWPGMTFFRGAWTALRSRTSHMDLPIALGLGAGGIAGTINTIRGTGEIYFDSLTALVFLLLVGRWIQARQQRRAADRVDLLYSLTPSSARRVDGQQAQIVPIDMLCVGDVVEVRAGETIPVDGVIEQGDSRLDCSLLTGESIPVIARVDEQVAAGSVNVDSNLLIRVAAVGEATRVGQLMQMIEESTAQKSRVIHFVDKIGGYFAATVITIAVLTYVVWLRYAPEVALEHAIALLIVACPCALGLATPLTLSVAIGRAARRKILIKGGDVLEKLSQPGMIWLDKTGTITEGRSKLIRWSGDESTRSAVAALERHSSHHVANALTKAVSAEEIAAHVVTDVRQTDVGGIIGSVDGRLMAVGNRSFVAQQGAEIAPEMEQVARQTIDDGLSPVYVAVQDRVVAVATVGDPIRGDTADVISSLGKDGWRFGILSGDHPEIVQRVAAAVGIPAENAHGAVMPEEKTETVTRQKCDGTTVMVGDGVNDAAALSAADVGIAVRGGAEVSLRAAPVFLAERGLKPLIDLIHASRATTRTIRVNLCVSLGYNVFTVGLAAAGWITPLVAAVLMPISSLTVLGLSITLPTFPRDREEETP